MGYGDLCPLDSFSYPSFLSILSMRKTYTFHITDIHPKRKRIKQTYIRNIIYTRAVPKVWEPKKASKKWIIIFLKLTCLFLKRTLMKLFMLFLLKTPSTENTERGSSVLTILSTKLRNVFRGTFRTPSNI